MSQIKEQLKMDKIDKSEIIDRIEKTGIIRL